MILNQSTNSNQLDNKYLFGLIMIIINLGARFIIDDLTPHQKKLINNHITRKIIVFLVFYIATKDLLVSLTLTVIYILFMSDLLNEILKKEKKNDDLYI
tara:strand:+ start:23 stop:319 length:297 start_codon:yes stop_codon:yes gene_type:complete